MTNKRFMHMAGLTLLLALGSAASAKSEDGAKMFERLDADGNGTLSAEEFAKVAERGHRRAGKRSSD